MEPNVGIDEFYARQLCTYFIMQGIQYELISNEMEGNVEVLVLREMVVIYQVRMSEAFVNEAYISNLEVQMNVKIIHCSYVSLVRHILKLFAIY